MPDPERMGGFSHPFRHPQCDAVVGIGKDRDKLLASLSVQEISLARHLTEALRDGAQSVIACMVAVTLVEPSEVVDVDEADGAGAPVARYVPDCERLDLL